MISGIHSTPFQNPWGVAWAWHTQQKQEKRYNMFSFSYTIIYDHLVNNVAFQINWNLIIDNLYFSKFNGIQKKNFCIWETLNLLTDADSSTEIIKSFLKADSMKTRRGRTPDTWHLTHDMWHVTCDTWHVKRDMWHIVGDENSLKMSSYLILYISS